LLKEQKRGSSDRFLDQKRGSSYFLDTWSARGNPQMICLSQYCKRSTVEQDQKQFKSVQQNSLVGFNLISTALPIT